MNKSIFCSECQLGRKVSMVGNGITQPPYLTLIQCPFEKIYYMDKYSECTHVTEKEKYLEENNLSKRI